MDPKKVMMTFLKSMKIVCTYISSELATKLNSKITFMSMSNMTQSIIYQKDTSNAYVIKESRAYFFIVLLNYAEMRHGPIFRIMKEPIGMLKYKRI